jgi:hypothetical protein
MQEKRNKRLLITLVVLLAATAATVWYGKRDNTFEVDDTIFRKADLREVNEVVLQSPAGKIDLKYLGSAWKVNEVYNADRNMIEVLFATLGQAKPKRPVAQSQQDSISKAIEKSGVKVSLISGGKTVEEFFAGGNEAKTQAYFKSVEAGTPYVMSIPGYRVYVSGIFELNEKGWRDKYVFGFNWRNFKNLEARFPKREADNFLVEMDDNFFGIKGVQTDTAKMNNFLDAVSLLTVDEYIDPSPTLDSLSQKDPLFVLTITDIAEKKYELKIFSADSRQFFGQVGNDWSVLHENKIRAILHPKRYFLK